MGAGICCSIVAGGSPKASHDSGSQDLGGWWPWARSGRGALPSGTQRYTIWRHTGRGCAHTHTCPLLHTRGARHTHKCADPHLTPHTHLVPPLLSNTCFMLVTGKKQTRPTLIPHMRTGPTPRTATPLTLPTPPRPSLPGVSSHAQIRAHPGSLVPPAALEK